MRTSERSTPRATSAPAIRGLTPVMTQNAPTSRVAATSRKKCPAVAVSTRSTPVMSMITQRARDRVTRSSSSPVMSSARWASISPTTGSARMSSHSSTTGVDMSRIAARWRSIVASFSASSSREASSSPIVPGCSRTVGPSCRTNRPTAPPTPATRPSSSIARRSTAGSYSSRQTDASRSWIRSIRRSATGIASEATPAIYPNCAGPRRACRPQTPGSSRTSSARPRASRPAQAQLS